MEIRKSEIRRYLGYRSVSVDEQIEGFIDDITEEMLSRVTPRAVYKEFSLEFHGQRILIGGKFGMEIESRDLCKNLMNCSSVILFAATLGTAADMMVKRYSLTSMTKAAVSQAAATEIIEAYCDEVEEKIRAEYGEKGLKLRPRYSAGYGDFSLEFQKDFFRLLNISKELGVSLNDQLLMQPTKSVTAVIGLSADGGSKHIKKCGNCTKKDCEYKYEN